MTGVKRVGAVDQGSERTHQDHGSGAGLQNQDSGKGQQDQGSDTRQQGSASEISYRRVRPEDAEALHGLSVSVRWSHRLEDWRLLISVGSGFVALVEGRVIGVTLYWHQGNTHATVGCVIVAASLQGRGIGHVLMTQTLAECADRTVSLNATPQGEGLYARLGFEYRSVTAQHQAIMGECKAIPPQIGYSLRGMVPSDHATVIALHTEASGLSRVQVLPAYLAVAQGVVLMRATEAVGFALFRQSGRGFAIGPVVAPDFASAQVLVSHWLSSNSGHFVRIDIPESDAMCTWLEGLGLPKVDRLQVMVLGDSPKVPPSPSVFALINQALA